MGSNSPNSADTPSGFLVDIGEDRAYFRERIQEARDFLVKFREELLAYVERAEELDRRIEDIGYAEATALAERMYAITVQMEQRVDDAVSQPAAHTDWFRDLLMRFRSYCALKPSLVKSVSMMSPPYMQSRDLNVFPAGLYGSLGKQWNYVRSTNMWRDSLADRWLRLLEFDQAGCELVATSSGMAAYSLVENYLTSEVLGPGAVVFVPRFTYAETNILQFRNKRLFTEIMEEHRSSAAVIERIRELAPDVVMLETMQNGLGTEVLDTLGIIKAIGGLALGKTVHIVLDETLAPGCVNPFQEQIPGVEVYYIFSGSKYLQLGLDLGLAGAVVVRRALAEHMRQLSYMGGYCLYDCAAVALPSFTRERLEKRQARLRRNGALIAHRLASSEQLRDLVKVFCPTAGLPSHGETGVALPLAGGLITIDLAFAGAARDALNMRPYYEYASSVIERAHTLSVPLTYCESFGFPWTSLNVLGWCWESKMPPFIRLSPGEECQAEAVRIADFLHDHLVDFAHEYLRRESVFDGVCKRRV